MFGIDYSHGSGLTVAQMKAAGVKFVCRYLCYLPNGKVINKTELTNLLNGGIPVVLCWEYSGRDCDRSHNGGVHDAREAQRQAIALGLPNAAIYFAPADFDATPDDQTKVNAYLDGAASVIGRERLGMYAGYWPLSRAFAAGKITYGWQTYAWSGTNLERRAHIFQYQNGMRLGPAEVDFDRSLKRDFGQHPHPVPPGPEPTGPYRHVIAAGRPPAVTRIDPGDSRRVVNRITLRDSRGRSRRHPAGPSASSTTPCPLRPGRLPRG